MFKDLLPTLGVGLLDFKLNSSPCPVYSWVIPGVPKPKVSLRCPTLECPWSAQPKPRVSLGVPNPRVSSECPAQLPRVPDECFRSAQFGSLPPESPWSAQPQSVPGGPNPRVSLPREGGDV